MLRSHPGGLCIIAHAHVLSFVPKTAHTAPNLSCHQVLIPDLHRRKGKSDLDRRALHFSHVSHRKQSQEAVLPLSILFPLLGHFSTKFCFGAGVKDLDAFPAPERNPKIAAAPKKAAQTPSSRLTDQ